ncbi:hypothetical protein DPEC_G00225890 [Dallia pectoralis]|uniref:Uncharacterized protein n=1 Tax=Dallia pectoralis TaxID=75939 RepID=A0ACC2G0S8_DALPE|nr:hypothetical protein DPEC_G00225890 [Dallia pectoralis]
MLTCQRSALLVVSSSQKTTLRCSYQDLVDVCEVAVQVVRFVSGQLVDYLLLVGLHGLLINGLKDFTLDIVLQLFSSLTPTLEPTVEVGVVCAEHKDLEPAFGEEVAAVIAHDHPYIPHFIFKLIHHPFFIRHWYSSSKPSNSCPSCVKSPTLTYVIPVLKLYS